MAAPPGPNPPARRTDTGQSFWSQGRANTDLLLAAQQKDTQVQPPELLSVYGLPWPRLRRWLDTRFQDQSINMEPSVQGDYYVLVLPEGCTLSDNDKKAIEGLRDRVIIPPGRPQSPEPARKRP